MPQLLLQGQGVSWLLDQRMMQASSPDHSPSLSFQDIPGPWLSSASVLTALLVPLFRLPGSLPRTPSHRHPDPSLLLETFTCASLYMGCFSSPRLRPLHTQIQCSQQTRLPAPAPTPKPSLPCVLSLRERQSHHQAKPTFILSSSLPPHSPSAAAAAKSTDRVRLCETP